MPSVLRSRSNHKTHLEDWEGCGKPPYESKTENSINTENDRQLCLERPTQIRLTHKRKTTNTNFVNCIKMIIKKI